MEEVLGKHVAHFIIFCICEKFTEPIESCCSYVPAETETESKQPVGEATVNYVYGVFYHNVALFFLDTIPASSKPKPDCMVKIMNAEVRIQVASSDWIASYCRCIPPADADEILTEKSVVAFD